LTLTAVHHLRDEDTGIGSGVLNTMQQVGGALGLSLLSTIATRTITDRVSDLGAAQQAAGAGGSATESQVRALQALVQQQVFTEGATHAFLIGSILMLAASAVTWTFLNVKHQELATDGPEVVHAGV
jgi:hypothetical protein